MSSFKFDKASVFMSQLELIADFWLNLIDWAYQISANEIYEIHFHALYTNAREICASELKIWECKQKIFSENAAQDQIIAYRNKLDWNLKQEDKTWWEIEQIKNFSRKVWYKVR